MHLQSTTLGGVLTQWQQINQQVTDYINAGGSVATANIFPTRCNNWLRPQQAAYNKRIRQRLVMVKI